MISTRWRIAGLGLALSILLLAANMHGVAAQEIKLKLSHFAPTAHNHHASVIVPWVEEVKKRTNGRVEITVFPGASLCKPTQQYDCAKSGIADLAWGVTGWTPGRFPMTSVIELPFLVRTAAVSAQILADLWEPYLQREFDDVHVLYLHTPPAVHINTHSKPIRVKDDFKGMKIRIPTAVMGSVLETLGATPVGMPANEIYQNMSTKVLDGFTMPFEALPPFRLHEVSKYHTEVWISGSAAFAMYMNKAKYATLPADVRQVLDETTSHLWYWKQVGESWDKAEVGARQVVEAHKNQIYPLPEEERRRWREAVKGLDAKWAAELDAKGLPGQALIQEARALAVKYGEGE
jgi:TRAP-type C4-dicarboxylate transport system substrate-binding protein